MVHDPGRLLLVTFPFSDQTGLKQRPVLVVSGVAFNQGEDFVVVPLSSRVSPDDHWGIPIYDKDSFFPQTGLRQSSSIKWTKPMTISSKVVHRRLGIIPAALLAEVQGKLQSLFVA